MKVWILIIDSWEDREIISVHASHDGATASMQKWKVDNPPKPRVEGEPELGFYSTYTTPGEPYIEEVDVLP